MNTKSNNKYKITSPIRFTIFMVVIILCLLTTLGTVFGLNTANSTSVTQYNQVQIHTGDTIWDIAEEYTPDNKDVRQVVYEICELNEINADQLEAGQKLIIPVYN